MLLWEIHIWCFLLSKSRLLNKAMYDIDTQLIYEAYLLREMKIIGDIPKQNQEYYIVGHQDRIWVFLDDIFNQDDEQFQDMVTTLNQSDYDNDYPELYPGDLENITDLSNYEQYYPDFIFGVVRDGTLYLYNDTVANYYNPQTSLLLNKILKSLKITRVETNEESSHVGEYTGFPKWGYHGTSSKYLYDILRLGLRAGRNDGNWGDIRHTDKIFFTQVEELAIFHSLNVSRGDDNEYPIIIEFKIPDTDKIIPDYDKDTESNKSNDFDSIYSDIRQSVERPFQDVKSGFTPLRRSNEGGVWGYHGSIMPKFIDSIRIYTEGDDNPEFSDYVEFDDLQYVKRVMELCAEYDENFIYYLGMDIEDIEQEFNSEEEE